MGFIWSGHKFQIWSIRVLHDISMAQGSFVSCQEVTLRDVNKMEWYQSAIQNITEKNVWLFD